MKWHIKSVRFKIFVISCISMATCFMFYQPAPGRQKVDLPYVVVHLDLKRSPLKLQYVETLLPMFSKHGVNALLMEYEDMFPYTGSLTSLRADYSYERFELNNFLQLAAKSGFEIIPLVQTFGHMEFVLKMEKFKHLREVSNMSNSICPSKKRSLKLIKEMLTQVINLHSTISPLKHIHVGCDEVFSLKKCDDCKQRQESGNEIFLKHVKVVGKLVTHLSKDTVVLVWDDMFRTIKPEWKTMERIDNIEPVYWNYEPKVKVSDFALYQYHKWFRNIWIASAFKGADGQAATSPNLIKRFKNNLSWMRNIFEYKFGGEIETHKFKGIILTGWSRYSHFESMCELLPASVPSLVLNLILINKFKDGIDSKAKLDSWGLFYSNYLTSEYSKALNCTKKERVELRNSSLTSCDFSGKNLYYSIKNLEILNNTILKCARQISKAYYLHLITVINNTKNCDKEWYSSINKDLLLAENDISKSMSEYYDKKVIDDYILSKTESSRKMLNSINKMYVLNKSVPLRDFLATNSMEPEYDYSK